MTTATLADRHAFFKALESADQRTLDGSALHVMRLDGRSFSTYTKALEAPFDHAFVAAMDTAGAAVAQEFGARLTYVASDEVSLVLTGSGPNFDMPFAGKLDKFLSVVAAHMTAHFNLVMYPRTGTLATFDARVVTLSDAAEVREYLLWRQADTYRNAVMMAAQSMFTHHELVGVGVREARARVEAKTGQPLDVTYPAGVLAGRQVLREVTTAPVTFTHTRTQEVTTVLAERSSWVARTAPAYRDLQVEDVAALLPTPQPVAGA